MNSVERVREYTIDLPQESQGGKEPPAHWPSNDSGIKVENLIIRYAENLQPALKGVSFDVKPSVSRYPHCSHAVSDRRLYLRVAWGGLIYRNEWPL